MRVPKLSNLIPNNRPSELLGAKEFSEKVKLVLILKGKIVFSGHIVKMELFQACEYSRGHHKYDRSALRSHSSEVISPEHSLK